MTHLTKYGFSEVEDEIFWQPDQATESVVVSDEGLREMAKAFVRCLWSAPRYGPVELVEPPLVRKDVTPPGSQLRTEQITRFDQVEANENLLLALKENGV